MKAEKLFLRDAVLFSSCLSLSEAAVREAERKAVKLLLREPIAKRALLIALLVTLLLPPITAPEEEGEEVSGRAVKLLLFGALSLPSMTTIELALATRGADDLSKLSFLVNTANTELLFVVVVVVVCGCWLWLLVHV